MELAQHHAEPEIQVFYWKCLKRYTVFSAFHYFVGSYMLPFKCWVHRSGLLNHFVFVKVNMFDAIIVAVQHLHVLILQPCNKHAITILHSYYKKTILSCFRIISNFVFIKMDNQSVSTIINKALTQSKGQSPRLNNMSSLSTLTYT